MANGSSIHVRVIKNDFGRIQTSMVSKSADMTEQTAAAIVTDARRRAPMRSGDLRGSIQPRKVGLGWVVVTESPYAARIEFGFHGADSLGRHYSQAAQPYLTPAAEAQRRPYLSRLAAALGSVR